MDGIEECCFIVEVEVVDIVDRHMLMIILSEWQNIYELFFPQIFHLFRDFYYQ